MFKNVFIAAAIVLASPSFVAAQDVFFSFDSQAAMSTLSAGADDMTGSVYVFSDGLFGFDVLAVDVSNSNSDAIRFTGGEVFNPTFDVIGGKRFGGVELTIGEGGDTARLIY